MSLMFLHWHANEHYLREKIQRQNVENEVHVDRVMIKDTMTKWPVQNFNHGTKHQKQLDVTDVYNILF